MSKNFFGSRSRGRRRSLQVIPDGDEVTHFKDTEMAEDAVKKMIIRQRGRRGSLPSPQVNNVNTYMSRSFQGQMRGGGGRCCHLMQVNRGS